LDVFAAATFLAANQNQVDLFYPVAIPGGDDVSKAGEVIGIVFENPELMV
jgi:hypothetical protein